MSIPGTRLPGPGLFRVVVVGLTLLVLGEGWWLWRSHVAALRAVSKLAKLERAWRVVGEVEPFPSEATAAAIEVALGEAERRQGGLRERLRGEGGVALGLRAAEAPAEATEAFFDIVTMVERLRESARREGVALGGEERFAFASYVNAGPEREWLVAVFRQRQVIEQVVRLLIATKPRALLAVQREAPVAVGDSGASRARAAGKPVPDWGRDVFAIDPRLSVREPGLVEAQAYRVTFVAQTAGLRSFLNAVVTSDLPLWVRAVEVEPAEPAAETAVNAVERDPVEAALAGAAAGAGGTLDTPKPVIAAGWSKFTVTLEWVEWVESPATPSP